MMDKHSKSLSFLIANNQQPLCQNAVSRPQPRPLKYGQSAQESDPLRFLSTFLRRELDKTPEELCVSPKTGGSQEGSQWPHTLLLSIYRQTEI